MRDTIRRLFEDERVRFLFVGACNTVIGYSLFALSLWLLGSQRYLLASLVSWVISVVFGYFNLKRFVFRSTGHWVRELPRAYAVYGPTYLINVVILWLAVELGGLPPLAGQLIAIGIATIFSYLGHKYFTFRSPEDLGGTDE